MGNTNETATEILQAVEAGLNAMFLERRDVIRGLLVAAIAGEHVLLLGPPGTAKSALARAFAEGTAAGSYFEKQLTKFTVPEEIFGPISFEGLKASRYERVIDGYAPDRRVLFLDEIWKASSSILNTLLTMMQDRTMTNGTQLLPLPLQTVVGASNEYPQDDSLQALYDRFALRYWVDYLADVNNVRRMVEDYTQMVVLVNRLSHAQLCALQRHMREIDFTPHIDTLLIIKKTVEDAGFRASDRTWCKAVNLVRASAVLDGRDKIIGSDFLILAHALWKEHKDAPTLREVIGNAADPYGARAEAIIDTVRTAMSELPSMDQLRTGAQTKTEAITEIAVVSGKVVAARDRAISLGQESQSAQIAEARRVVDLAMEQIDALSREVVQYRT